MNDELTARRIVRERSGGVCECCGSARATDFSHRRARSQQGAWSAENGVDACRPCHRRMHTNPEWARENGLHVASYDNPADVPVRLRYGRVLLLADGRVVPKPLDVALPDDANEILSLLKGEP